MAGRVQGVVTYAPVGNPLENGYEIGGSRFYPWSSGFAMAPPVYYSDYIGPGTGLPVSVPAGSLPDTTGAAPQSHAAVAEAAEHPFGRTSPLPWAVIGLSGGLLALWAVHYKDKGGE